MYAAGLVLRALGAPEALTAAMAASVPEERPTASAARDVLAEAEVGPPDPTGPAAFAPCPADESLAVAFSPEGCLLVCDHVPATRRYEWQPQTSEG
ncbi:hypothetical protein [Streptomyces sp. NRRL B-24572]|uniref:hypothetical protein n=1 Tax=Streptomyces sp. NRRL B-24572 TaxID=1962156 RepID=UPI0015C50C42|nr:hypothetical protein [Streptomyces sp. NRRL B-24572]